MRISIDIDSRTSCNFRIGVDGSNVVCFAEVIPSDNPIFLSVVSRVKKGGIHTLQSQG